MNDYVGLREQEKRDKEYLERKKRLEKNFKKLKEGSIAIIIHKGHRR